MAANIFWIDGILKGRLGIMPCPAGGDQLERDVHALRAQATDVLVSVLEDHEIQALQLQREAEICGKAGIEYVSFPIPDRGVPPLNAETAGRIRAFSNRIEDGKAIVIHCQMGVGRSSLVAASMMASLGTDPCAAFTTIQRARGASVPDTVEQRDWVSRFAVSMLGGQRG